ncbi:MAG: hypothetical protein Q9218_008015 [Villophora microphyllina]
MASRLSWVRNLKAKQLEAIARATGINSSGTKAALISNLEEELPPTRNDDNSSAPPFKKGSSKRKHNDYNILSIDPGIRNFAYCHLSLPTSWLQSTQSQTPNTKVSNKSLTPTLKSWSRHDISASNSPSALDPKQKIGSFDPQTYARYSYDLLTRTLLPLRPTHILIERQRYRSLGGSAVQEWTLRVNMFEAMLYSTLFTLKQQDVWEGEVVPINPSKIGKFWLRGDGDDGGALRSEKKTKARKMEVVRDMVGNGWGVQLPEGSGDSDDKEENTEAKTRKKKTGLLTKSGDLRKGGKFDDLADCLLQGLAWCRWQENRRAVWELGEDVLEQMGAVGEQKKREVKKRKVSKGGQGN